MKHARQLAEPIILDIKSVLHRHSHPARPRKVFRVVVRLARARLSRALHRLVDIFLAAFLLVEALLAYLSELHDLLVEVVDVGVQVAYFSL